MLPALAVYPEGVDPGEAILAVIGVGPLLTPEVERITAPQWEEIEHLGKRIHDLARALARGTLDKEPAPAEVDYETTLDAFTQPPEPGQVMAMLQDIPLADGQSFLGAAARAYNTLRAQYPICVERTLFGTTTLEPGSFALGMFEDLLAMADDPLRIFWAISEGWLTSAQVQVLQQVYPTLSFEIAVAIVERCMAEKHEHPNWDPDFGRGLALLLGAPGMDPNLRAQLALSQPEEEQPPQKGAPPRSRRARLVATKSDRMELQEDEGR